MIHSLADFPYFYQDAQAWPAQQREWVGITETTSSKEILAHLVMRSSWKKTVKWKKKLFYRCQPTINLAWKHQTNTYFQKILRIFKQQYRKQMCCMRRCTEDDMPWKKVANNTTVSSRYIFSALLMQQKIHQLIRAHFPAEKLWQLINL